MKEHPVASGIVETPVLDPAVYLLRRDNKAFLEGRSRNFETKPILRNSFLAVDVILWFAALEVFLLLVFNSAFPCAVLECAVVLAALIGQRQYNRWRKDQVKGQVLTGIVVQAETVRVLFDRREMEK